MFYANNCWGTMVMFGEGFSMDGDEHQVQRVFSIPNFEGSCSLCTVRVSIKCVKCIFKNTHFSMYIHRYIQA